jgi:opacity protein-like surface antigen
MQPVKRTLNCLTTIAALTLFCSLPVMAQDERPRPKAEIRLTGGASGFTGDDGEIPHGVVGGSFRIYVTRRVSIEPEFLYMTNNPNDRDYLGQVNAAYDFDDLSKRFVPYVVAGAGVLRHRSEFFGVDFVTRQPRTYDTSYTSVAVSAGGGVKIFLTKGLFVAPEGRVGYQPSIRGTISIGYVF